MGIFDKVKSFAKKLTGGSAKVFVESDPVCFGSPFEVRIKAEVQDENIRIDRVYLNVVGTELVKARASDVVRNSDGSTRTRTKTVELSHETFNDEITVKGASNLVANQTYEWKTEITIPNGSLPIYHGFNARHGYYIRAGLDMSGNDPDSGWVELK
ncbi:MAG: hypothetical protein JJ966_12000 [Balneolaceae bacterium]|nr:hypothetical protein [Balneolaceae bacterium]